MINDQKTQRKKNQQQQSIRRREYLAIAPDWMLRLRHLSRHFLPVFSPPIRVRPTDGEVSLFGPKLTDYFSSWFRGAELTAVL